MAGSKEAELVTAVLLYAVRCHAEGDHAALRAMNFGPREVQALEGLDLADLARVRSLPSHCLSLALDRDLFWALVGHLKRERESAAVQEALMQADAPLEMMRALFGLGSREYTQRRRELGVTPVVGRSPEPEEAIAAAVWAAWSRRREVSGGVSLCAADYLAIHRETGATLRALWGLVRRWLAEEDSPAPEAPLRRGGPRGQAEGAPRVGAAAHAR